MNTADKAAVDQVHFLNKVLAKCGNISFPVAKWRDMELYYIDSIKQILAEGTVFDHLLKILVCTADNPNI